VSEAKPVYRYTTKKFAEAINVHPRTVKRLVREGKIRSVLLTPRVRRLEEPEAFQARMAS
jgi:excisionase family DNA binding protein